MNRIALRRLAAHVLDLADEPIFVLWTLWWIEPTKSGIRLSFGIAWIAWVSWQLVAQGRTAQSVGKRLLEIEVVSIQDGSPLGLKRTLIRWLLHGIDTASIIGWIVAAFTNRSFADRIMASTVQRSPSNQIQITAIE